MANIRARKNSKGKITSYQIRVFKGKNSEGKELTPYLKTVKPFPLTWSAERVEKELQKLATLFEQECKEGFVTDNKETFEKYSTYVVELKERNGAKHKTINSYKGLLGRINPAIGHFKIGEIKPQHLNKFYEQLSKDGMNMSTGGKLSNKTIVEHHRLIRTILNQAEKEMLVPYNAASKASPPKIKKTEANYLEIETIETILKYLSEEPLKWQVAMQLLIFTGCRRGEISGLKIDKINMAKNQIEISNNLLYTKEQGLYEDTLKTESSKRTLKLPADVMQLLNKQIKELKANRLKRGDKWINSGYLLTQEDGNPMYPDSITDYCNKFRTRINKKIELNNKNSKKDEQEKLLPHINPHAFRHSQASMLFFSGLDPITISKRLGHSKVSTTSDIYSHIMQKADESASDTLASVLINKNKKIGQKLDKAPT